MRCVYYNNTQLNMIDRSHEMSYLKFKFSLFSDKKFFSRKALQTHLKTLAEKRYKCQRCGKSFKQQGELTIHTRSHT